MTGPDMHGDAIDEGLRRRFESAWLEGRPEPIEQFLPPEEDPNYLATLEGLVRLELELAWKSWLKAGQRNSAGPQDETVVQPPRVEDYLKRFPRLNQPEIVLRLLEQERSVRKQYGEEASTEEYRQRFPGLVNADGQFEAALPMLSESSQDAQLAETLPTGRPGGATATGIRSGQFGNYESLEEIGRGGMGVVYRARQRTADRIVALKVIRRDRLESLPRDTHTNALNRFRHEAQAAAKLEHENIVTVYEVGEVDEQPFFSMRYVEGRSLAEILREGPMEGRRAAAYIEPVARAVHEAHSHGILHRDLKPQNILVDSKTDRALVADFGLAKLSEGNDELTRSGEVMGTPSYMSPEQAKDSARVNEKTDIYALGATLYHVLTARPPFQAATAVETLRQVIDEEPARPRQLNPSIHRDLETVCLKCLQKEPSRRYDSAHALADDLRRYLRGEPILARPIGTLGRILRWCRRNPAVATLTGVAATFLILALVATTVGYIKTSSALEESEESLSQARDAVYNFYTSVADHRLLDEPGMQPLRRELLARARTYYQQLLDEHSDDPRIRDDLAKAHFHVGRITEEIDSAEKALKSYQRARQMQEQLVSERPAEEEPLQALGDTLNAIGSTLAQMQKLDEAADVYGEAIARRTQLVKAVPQESEPKRKLANSHMNLGLVEKERGDPQAAVRQMERAQVIREKLLRQHPGDSKVRRDLGMGYYNLANLAMTLREYVDAEKNFEHAVEVFEKLVESDSEDLLNNQHRLAICCRLLANLKAELRKVTTDQDAALRLYQESLAVYQKALGLMETLAGNNPARLDYQAELAVLYMDLGLLESEQANLQAALESFQQAHDILKVLVEGYPDNPEYRRDFAVTLREIGSLQSDAGEYQGARGNLETAKKLLSELVELFPDNAELRRQLDRTIAVLGGLNATPPDKE